MMVVVMMITMLSQTSLFREFMVVCGSLQLKKNRKMRILTVIINNPKNPEVFTLTKYIME